MRTIIRKVGRWVCLGLIAWQGVVHAQTPTLEKQPEFEVGDKWTYRYTNIGDRKDPVLHTNQAFRSANGSGWIYGESMDPDAKRKYFVLRYDYKRGEVKERFAFNENKPRVPGPRYNNFMPLDDELQFPLTVGKEYKIKREWANGEGYDRYDVTVEAFERIKVEAGEFDVFRIKLSGRWTRTEDGDANGRTETTYWYAPAVKRIIKTIYMAANVRGSPWNQSETELVNWEPRAPLPAVFN